MVSYFLICFVGFFIMDSCLVECHIVLMPVKKDLFCSLPVLLLSIMTPHIHSNSGGSKRNERVSEEGMEVQSELNLGGRHISL